MSKVIILKGLPGSGKSTWAKERVQNTEWKRVNKDDLRAMIDNGKWSKGNEKFVLKIRDHIILEAVKNKTNVIVDDTNLDSKHEEHIRKLVKNLATVEVKFFDTPVQKCIERDLKRPNSVGEKIIKFYYRKYLQPKEEIIVFDPALPYAIICDIDGTIAKMVDRGPYEWDKVDTDHLDTTINSILDRYAGVKKILLSGRDGSCQEKTEMWLYQNAVVYDELYMRPAGNREKDAIIKRRIFDENIRGKYNILFILDDRNQVVEMWRSLGLTCLQVADGDF